MSQAYHLDDDVKRRPYDRHLMRRLLVYVAPFRKLLISAVALLLLIALLDSALPWIQWNAIEKYINSTERAAVQTQVERGERPATDLEQRKAQDKHNLFHLMGTMGGVILGSMALRYAQMMLVAYVGQKAMMGMRLDLFNHLQRMSLRFLDRNPVGRLMTRVTSDVEKIQEAIVSGVVQGIADLFVIVVVIGFMVWNNWVLALIVLSPVPLVFLTSLVFRKYAQRSYSEIRRKLAHLNSYMQENLSGMRVVQVFCRETPNYREYCARNAEHRDEWLRQVRYYAYYFPVVDFLGSLSTALIILFGGRIILHEQHLTPGMLADVGMFFAYVQWSDRLYGPIRSLADKYNMLLEAMASSERIFNVLDTPEDIPDKADAVVAGQIEGRVEFEDVWFSYDDPDAASEARWILKGVNLAIAPGERIAIVGHTGAGKTTFINLLSRFYDAQRGAVRVDGVGVRDYDKVSLRKSIGVVLQDVFLFSGSVEHNIRLGNPGLDLDHVRAAAQHVNAARFVEALPQGYDYDVGERGCNLSTGQRQLLAFARALAHDPRILVLDEATSSVDTETEGLIQDAIAKLMDNRTSIVIAHRLSTVQHADRIIVMHHGEIRESGTHQDLLAKRGLYYRLYQLQYKDQAPQNIPL